MLSQGSLMLALERLCVPEMLPMPFPPSRWAALNALSAVLGCSSDFTDNSPFVSEAAGPHNLCKRQLSFALHSLTHTACCLLRTFPEHVMACNGGNEHVQWQKFAVFTLHS